MKFKHIDGFSNTYSNSLEFSRVMVTSEVIQFVKWDGDESGKVVAQFNISELGTLNIIIAED